MESKTTTEIDIIIPVYNEGEGILAVLESLKRHVHTSFRVLICYDRDEDTTLDVLRGASGLRVDVRLVKNRYSGAHGAVVTGFEESSASAVLVFPGDDDYNAARVDLMFEQFRSGCEIVAASRFMRGGCMKGCPWIKAAFVRSSAFVLYHVARVPTHDPSNGFRLFSRRLLQAIPIESKVGFTYSLELLAKCHRLGWKIGEVPVAWYERTQGASRFRVMKWAPHYLVWFFYCFATAMRLKTSDSVRIKAGM
jgi:dolichol-phosphate mannosyltransferase